MAKRTVKAYRVYNGKNFDGNADRSDFNMSSDVKALKRLDETLSAIEGQDFACQAVKEYLFTNARRVNDKGVAGLLVFAGAPAVGKTYMAELIAKALNRPFERFDMSGYSDKESLNTLCGVHVSYKSSHVGLLTDFINRHPVSVVLLDEIEKAHPNVLQILLQMLERGSIQDIFTEKDVSVRDCIVIMTTNAGKSVYDKEVGSYIFSRTPQSVIINALKSEMDPQTNSPYFSDALISRFTQGKLIMFNKIRPETMCQIAANAIDEQVDYYNGLYGVKIDVDKETLAKLLILEQGESADVRSTLRAARDFFERHFERIARKMKDNNCRLEKISVKIEELNVGEKGRLTKNKILVFCQKSDKKLFSDCGKDKTEFVFAEEKMKIDVSKSDFSAAFIDVSDEDGLAIELFRSVMEDQSLPIYVYNKNAKSVSDFLYYTDNGATDCFSVKTKRETFEEWIKKLVDGTDLSAVTQEYFRTNKIVRFDARNACKDDSCAVLEIYNVRTQTAFNADDSRQFVVGRSIPDVTYDDIIGGEVAKSSLFPMIEMLNDYKKYLRLGLRIPRGILLSGAPGVGKTMLAKALAHEAGLPFIQKGALEFLNKFEGEGPRLVREVFATARRYAPTILFIDEIDAIAGSRLSDNARANTHDILNQFLSEMDGFNDNKSAPVFVIAATNFNVKKGESSLDEAFLRRFDEKIHIELPNKDERLEFIFKTLKKYQITTVTDAMIDNIARRSIGWSLADLNLVIQNALRKAGENADRLYLDDDAINEAFESFMSGASKNYDEAKLKKTAYHEAGHAVVAMLLNIPVSYATITARDDYGGYVYYGDESVTEYTKEDMENRICVSMAGRAGEVKFYGEKGVTSGASGDLRTATAYAAAMICDYGMAEDLVYLGTAERQSDKVRAKMHRIIKSQYERAIGIISENADKVRAVAAALLEKSSLGEAQLRHIIIGE